MLGFTTSAAFWTAVLSVSSLATRAVASPVRPEDLYERPEGLDQRDLDALLERDASSNETHTFDERGFFAVKGAPGKIHPRLEIRSLHYNHPTQFNMYILALQHMQAISQSNKLSWFQIAGIHGAPNIPWDGVGQTASGIGYCTHSINLFPTWHRPYVALFEQRLQQSAKFVASKFPKANRKKYMLAAESLRAPFWDWAIQPAPNTGAMPYVLTSTTLVVQTPTGKETIRNPLFAYQYSPIDSNDFAPYNTPWSYWPSTLRYPNTESAGAYSNDAAAASTVNANRPGQQQNLYNWFTLCPDYMEISNDEAQFSTPNCHVSLESLHNNVHVWVGGNNDGHMTVIPVSANDPTFMLHHCQIDRLFAMWQAIYPNSWITNQPSPINTFTIAQGSIQGPSSPLTPFHRNTAGDFWTSDAVRNRKVFNYDYPDFHNGGSSGAMINRVNQLYGPNANLHATGPAKKKRDVSVEEEQLDSIAAPLQRRQAPANIIPLTVANNGSTFEYIANIASTRFGLNGSYTISVFIGEPATEDTLSWPTDPAFVGSYGVFSSPDMVNSKIVTTSTVPLTDALIARVASGSLASLSNADVVPYLAKQLTWRVGLATSQVLDPAEVPNFVLSVVGSTSAPPTSPDAFPVWSPFNVLHNVTSGKPGGLPLGQSLTYLGVSTLS